MLTARPLAQAKASDKRLCGCERDRKAAGTQKKKSAINALSFHMVPGRVYRSAITAPVISSQPAIQYVHSSMLVVP